MGAEKETRQPKLLTQRLSSVMQRGIYKGSKTTSPCQTIELSSLIIIYFILNDRINFECIKKFTVQNFSI